MERFFEVKITLIADDRVGWGLLLVLYWVCRLRCAVQKVD